MFIQILDFRLRQFWRILKSIGVAYFLLLIFVCIGFFLGLVDSVLQSTSPWVGLLGTIIVASIHFSRRDGGFLRLLGINRLKLYFWEYFLLLSPLTFLFLVGHNLGAIATQTIGLAIVAFLPNPELGGAHFANRLDFALLPKDAFELRSLLRKNLIILGLVYVGSLFVCQFTVVPITIVIILALLFVGLFDEVEGKALFEAVHFRGGILKRKILLYVGMFQLILLPQTILFLFFHLEYWYIILAVIFVCSTSIIFNVVYKYAQYAPYRRKVYNSMASSIFFGFALVPFLYPVTILYLFYYWRKARKNLRLFYAEY
jgi:hypothetical protein